MSVSYVIEKRDALGVGWDQLMDYGTEQQAITALPYFRKDTKRDLRIVRVQQQEIMRDEVNNA